MTELTIDVKKALELPFSECYFRTELGTPDGYCALGAAMAAIWGEDMVPRRVLLWREDDIEFLTDFVRTFKCIDGCKVMSMNNSEDYIEARKKVIKAVIDSGFAKPLDEEYAKGLRL